MGRGRDGEGGHAGTVCVVLCVGTGSAYKTRVGAGATFFRSACFLSSAASASFCLRSGLTGAAERGNGSERARDSVQAPGTTRVQTPPAVQTRTCLRLCARFQCKRASGRCGRSENTEKGRSCMRMCPSAMAHTRGGRQCRQSESSVPGGPALPCHAMPCHAMPASVYAAWHGMLEL